MIDHARVTAQNHAFTYDEQIKVESVTQAVCDLALRFGESVHDEDAMMVRLHEILSVKFSEILSRFAEPTFRRCITHWWN